MAKDLFTQTLTRTCLMFDIRLEELDIEAGEAEVQTDNTSSAPTPKPSSSSSSLSRG